MKKSLSLLPAPLAASLRELRRQYARRLRKTLRHALRRRRHRLARRLRGTSGFAGPRAVRALLRYLLVHLRPPAGYGTRGRAVAEAERPYVEAA